MEDMRKMLGRKKEADPMQKEAKLSALKGLRDEMSDMMRGDLSDKMNKVTVAAKDKEGLAHGLDKAKELLEGSPEEEASESPEMERMEEESGEDSDSDDASESKDKMTEDEIDEMMAKLAEMKKHLAMR